MRSFVAVLGSVGLMCSLAGCGESGPVMCASDADCVGLAGTTSCDTRTDTCIEPCAGDSVGDYACVDGARHYCSDDSSLPCTVCPGVCGAGMYCEAATLACAPLKAAGEPCAQDGECQNGTCTSGGLCSVEQGEACTEASCEGFCATEDGTGATVCLRRCAGSGQCGEPANDWVCIGFEAGAHCVPTCTSCFGSCSIGLCDNACNANGCVDFCAPEELHPDQFC